MKKEDFYYEAFNILLYSHNAIFYALLILGFIKSIVGLFLGDTFLFFIGFFMLAISGLIPLVNLIYVFPTIEKLNKQVEIIK